MADFDVAIVGSGFGGAVAAQRLAYAHRSVVVLERGDRWYWTNYEGLERQGDPMAYRNSDGSTRYFGEKKFFEHAVDPKYIYSIYEDLLDERALIGVATAVGGGSVIYSNISERAPRRIFDSRAWPSYTGAAGQQKQWDYEYLSSLYDIVEGANGQPYQIYTHIPTIEPPRYKILKYALEKIYGPGVLSLARVAVRNSVGDYYQGKLIGENVFGACRNCGFCTFGCVYGARQDLTTNYLPRAEMAGAKIWPNKNVTRIEYNSSAREWVVYYTESRTGVFIKSIESVSPEKSLTAKVVVLSAGTVGTPRILLQSKLPGISPHVGYHLSGNGDFVAGRFLPPAGTWNIAGLTSVDGFKGRVISGITREMAQTEGWVIEDMWAPPIAVGAKAPVRVQDPAWAEEGEFVDVGGPNRIYKVKRWKNPSFYGERQKQLLNEHHLRTLAVAFLGEDGCDGRVYLADDQVKIIPPTQTHSRDYARAINLIAAHLPEGTRLLDTKSIGAEDFFTTAHPLGTCRMASWAGRSPDDDGGVVDGNGRVFSTTGSFENLFICDGSVIPCATIVNPAWTIAAVAEHIAHYIARNFPQ